MGFSGILNEEGNESWREIVLLFCELRVLERFVTVSLEKPCRMYAGVYGRRTPEMKTV